ncbi:hypothetical protein AB205_0034600 [Aquarana catesbeiana]|uniref:BRO1 domain-containing protein n=1 Tax=Aquarana catesbeiana TaxID=8400 RepID=A0A2G9SHZ0_AQUCT|nr:hypothetical protein AB205_0034600 [Aquarana catesbeiana]
MNLLKINWLNFALYDSFTGVPVSQPNIYLEKASILFNIGALYTQIGTRCNRQTKSGLEEAVNMFQKAAGVLTYLKETFTYTPSYDMSPAMLGALIKMLLAEAHECHFEQTILSGVQNEFCTLAKVAQEAAKVSEIHLHVYNAMNQAPIKENMPYSWSVMVQVKAEHYKALAHYFVAIVLIEHQLGPHDDEDKQEKALSQLYDHIPEGLTAMNILKDKQQRTQLGKAHLSKALACHEEALRLSSLCSQLKQIDVLQDILAAFHKRALLKFTQHQKEDDFMSKAEFKAEIILPPLSRVKVIDLFQRLGPLSVFSAKQRWTAPRKVCLTLEDGDLGFVLKGDCPVQITSLDPLCPAAHNKSATYSAGMQKTYSLVCLDMHDDKIAKTQKATKKLSFLSWGFRNQQKASSTLCLPTASAGKPDSSKLFLSPYNTLASDSAMY